MPERLTVVVIWLEEGRRRLPWLWLENREADSGFPFHGDEHAPLVGGSLDAWHSKETDGSECPSA